MNNVFFIVVSYFIETTSISPPHPSPPRPTSIEDIVIIYIDPPSSCRGLELMKQVFFQEESTIFLKKETMQWNWMPCSPQQSLSLSLFDIEFPFSSFASKRCHARTLLRQSLCKWRHVCRRRQRGEMHVYRRLYWRYLFGIM